LQVLKKAKNKKNPQPPKPSQLSYIIRSVPFVLEKITETLHVLVRRNSAASGWPGRLKRT